MTGIADRLDDRKLQHEEGLEEYPALPRYGLHARQVAKRASAPERFNSFLGISLTATSWIGRCRLIYSTSTVLGFRMFNRT